MRIIKTKNSEELSEWDLRRVQDLDAQYFVYCYSTGSYDGSGWAIWKLSDGKFGYANLGHCSCNGPVEDLNSIPYTLDEIDKISRNYYSDYAEEVIDMVRSIENE